MCRQLTPHYLLTGRHLLGFFEQQKDPTLTIVLNVKMMSGTRELNAN